MKKLILFLLLSVPIFAVDSTKAILYNVNGGFAINDSLFSEYVDSLDGDTLHIWSAQEYKYIPLNLNFEWGYIEIQDTGTTYDDSLVVEQGVVGYSGNPASPTKVDTVWHQITLKDSAWNTISAPIVNDSSIQAYTIYCPLMEVIGIRRTNVEAVQSRVTYIKGIFRRIK